MELEAANYTGAVDFYYCCNAMANRTIAERLSRASKWVNGTSALVEDVKTALAAAGIKVNAVYISAWSGEVNIDISQPPGKGMSALAKVKNQLREVFWKYRDLPLLVMIDISEAPPPSPYLVGAEGDEVGRRISALYKLVWRLYNESGISVTPKDFIVGISPGKGVAMILIAPPNETEFLKQLTERSIKDLGTCPNGSIIDLVKSGPLELIGYEVAWGFVVLEIAAIAAVAAIVVYIIRRSRRNAARFNRRILRIPPLC